VLCQLINLNHSTNAILTIAPAQSGSGYDFLTAYSGAFTITPNSGWNSGQLVCNVTGPNVALFQLGSGGSFVNSTLVSAFSQGAAAFQTIQLQQVSNIYQFLNFTASANLVILPLNYNPANGIDLQRFRASNYQFFISPQLFVNLSNVATASSIYALTGSFQPVNTPTGYTILGSIGLSSQGSTTANVTAGFVIPAAALSVLNASQPLIAAASNGARVNLVLNGAGLYTANFGSLTLNGQGLYLFGSLNVLPPSTSSVPSTSPSTAASTSTTTTVIPPTTNPTRSSAVRVAIGSVAVLVAAAVVCL